jgi:beta-lactamase class D
MPLYFGIPVKSNEAIRILNLDFEKITLEVKKEKYYSDFTFVEVTNKYLQKISKIQIYYLDKGLCVVGFLIEETYDVWNKFINVDELIIKLLNLKILFQKEIEKLNGDLSKVTLEHMEGEPEIVTNPIPYILEWH